jgi:hypothetical protein
MVLGQVIKYNGNDNEEIDDDEEEIANDPDLISVHASFIIVNFQGLEAKDVQVDLRQGSNSNKTSVLLEAFEDFLSTLLATECPPHQHGHDNPVDCWERDPDATYDSAYDPLTGRLCGSHAEYVRRIYCQELQRQDPPERGRDLEPRHAVENIILYRVQDSHCPIPMTVQGKGKLRFLRSLNCI